MRGTLALGALVGSLAAATAAATGDVAPAPPETSLVQNLSPTPCTYHGDDPYQKRMYRMEGWHGPNYNRYPGACERLHFAYGPITVKPGQNDVLVGPVTIDRPSEDGYITGFKPDLVEADGTTPSISKVHLHHGTWLSYPDYGSGPFFAAGEEKTYAPFPMGYGMPYRTSDQWFLLYMVHSETAQPDEVYITYDLDFVPESKVDEAGLKPAYPIWLDVRPSGYPVFNVQRGYGSKDGTCTWPKQECAAFDPWGNTVVGQGEPGNGTGRDWTFPAKGERLGSIGSFTGGTLIGIGGHLHPGGIRNEIDLVRGHRSRRIYTSHAVYWDRHHPRRPGGPPTSWDFSMKVTGEPFWGVRVKPGDVLRSNVTYDTTIQSTYENMGIAVALLAPDGPNGKPTAKGLNPFEVKRDASAGCSSGGLQASPPTLCDKGIVTHGHLPESEEFGKPGGKWSAKPGQATSDVGIADFQYLPGDLSQRSTTGVPKVKLGTDLRFTNLEGNAIYHTVTSCAFPCLGQTGNAFPLADGKTSLGDRVDFDSGELGIGAPAIGPAKQTLEWSLPVTRKAGYTPGETVTYFCRIHPFMRGAFEVTK